MKDLANENIPKIDKTPKNAKITFYLIYRIIQFDSMHNYVITDKRIDDT